MMDLDEDFLKQITILYVEDDLNARDEIEELFQNFFKEVLVADNGDEALEIYNKATKENKYIDVIVSGINMPNKNGIELLEEVRKISNDIPFIFTTAYSDSPNLLNAIKYKVTSYILKPINVNALILEIQEYSKKVFEEREFGYEREEFNKYLQSIDKVAMVVKSDKEGNIIYANESFCETSKYSHDEILGQNYNAISHPEMAANILNEMWDEVRAGNFWKGKIKAKAKDESAFYMNTTTLPILDENQKDIVEYYHISFSITAEELEKRDFKKKVISNVQDSRRKDSAARKIIDELKEQLEQYKRLDAKYRHMDLVYESLEREKEKNKKYLKNIKYYASQLKSQEGENIDE